MIAVDTSAWIEWMQLTPVGVRIAALFPLPGDCLVPTMVQLELAKWIARHGNAAELATMMRSTGSCQVIDLDSRIAKRAALLHRRLKLATADAVIYATARTRRAQLLTCDAHFAHLPAVIYFPKT